MKERKGASITDYFQALEDPRIERSKLHKLLEIVTIAICATICGADSWVHMSCSAKARRSGSEPPFPRGQALSGTAPRHPVSRHLRWALRISSGVSKGIYKPVVQSDREFLRIGVGDGQ